MTYIEEYLEYLCKEKLDSLRPIDAIYFSIYKQTVRGLGLTDRQYALVLKKIQDYVSIEDLPTKIPLRTIDRSKYIKLVDTADVYGPDTVHESYKSNWKWIKVRFPFSKKDIVKIDSIQINHTEYYHKKGSHEHYYKFTSPNLKKIITALNTRNFEIEKDLLEIYKKIELMDKNLNTVEYCLPDDIKAYVKSLDKNNYADKSLRFGYKKPNKENIGTLTEQIAFREYDQICIDPKLYNFTDIAKSLNELDRFPLLVLIDEDESYQQLKEIHSALNFISNELQCVLFRIDNKDTKNNQVNDYIKNFNLNNWIDKNTKVVYIKKNKLPKVLLQSDFLPVCTIGKNSTRSNNSVSNYIHMFCDCIIYNDKRPSLFERKKFAIM